MLYVTGRSVSIVFRFSFAIAVGAMAVQSLLGLALEEDGQSRCRLGGSK
jgi:hypothetical protein